MTFQGLYWKHHLEGVTTQQFTKREGCRIFGIFEMQLFSVIVKKKLIIFSNKSPPPLSPAQTITKFLKTTHLAFSVFAVLKAIIKRQEECNAGISFQQSICSGIPWLDRYSSLAAFPEFHLLIKCLSSRLKKKESKNPPTGSSWESAIQPFHLCYRIFLKWILKSKNLAHHHIKVQIYDSIYLHVNKEFANKDDYPGLWRCTTMNPSSTY